MGAYVVVLAGVWVNLALGNPITSLLCSALVVAMAVHDMRKMLRGGK